jgi:hypothetical protein
MQKANFLREGKGGEKAGDSPDKLTVTSGYHPTLTLGTRNRVSWALARQADPGNHHLPS